MARQRSFTLIELFLSISLIALIGSVVLIRAKPMLDHYRFDHSYAKLKREIAFSKRLAQAATADIEFHIEQKGNNLICTRKTDEPLSLGRTINTPMIIPYLQLKGEKKKIILIISNGRVKEGYEIDVYLGNQKKTIDARE